jgi:peptidoglycan/xylan/chitin deacetylase (PgdA/CDA1 family)
MPGCFEIARMLGPSYSLRCVLFHDISAAETPFTAGMNVCTTPAKFEGALKFLTTHYTPVRLEDVLADFEGRRLPKRAVLLSFDDAYASVLEIAAPLCRKYGVPAIHFVNAAFLNNQRLAPDNLICYVANVKGMETIKAAARIVNRAEIPRLQFLSEVFSVLLPSFTLTEREIFLEALRQMAGITEERLAQSSALYLTTEQLRSLASSDFEIGNHTYSHVHCRHLSPAEFGQEIDKNQSELESLSGTKVRAFSQPYGSSTDLTAELAVHLKRTGHKAVFLSESVANRRGADLFHLNRVSSRVEGDDRFFLELEILPRVRAVRNRLFSATQAHSENAQLPS